MARVAGMNVGVHVDAERGTREFKEARRQFSRDLNSVIQGAAEDTVLPSAKQLAPGFIAPTLVVRKGASNTAYMTTRLRGKKGKVVGLLERGGTVKAPIEPKRAKAIFFPGAAHPVAIVTGPRHIKGKFFLARAVERKLPGFKQAVRVDILRAFRGFEIS